MMVHPRNETSERAHLPALSMSEIDEALRAFVLQDVSRLYGDPEDQVHGKLCSDPESAAKSAADVNLLLQRFLSISLDELDDVIVDLRRHGDLLRSENERLQHDLSGFLKVIVAALKSVRLIAANTKRWRRNPRDLEPTNAPVVSG
jgi:hypothetical protein